MSETALTVTPPAVAGLSIATARELPPVLWRDPHTVSPGQLSEHISTLELACEREPASPDLRTCLGMAYAMNFEAYKSMDALETAVKLDPEHFWAQLKYAELQFRLRILIKAERETLRAVALARSGFELAVARHQLQEIRKLMRDGTQKPEWTKSLRQPAVMLAMMMLFFSLMMVLR